MRASCKFRSAIWPRLRPRGCEWPSTSIIPAFTPDPDVVATTHVAAHALSDAGLTVEDSSPPGLEDVYPITLDYWRRPESDSPDEWVKGGVLDRRGLGPMTGEGVEPSLFEWDRFRRRMLPFIAEYPLGHRQV
jgi:amidase